MTIRETVSQRRMPAFLKPILMVAVPFLLGAVAVGLILRQRPALLGVSTATPVVRTEVDVIVSEVGTLIDLPTDEKPTIATVTDPEKLREQEFFRNAQNGDKVLIYTNARRMILYRPTQKKIIEVGAVNVKQQQEDQSQAPDKKTEGETPTPNPSPLKTPQSVE